METDPMRLLKCS